MTEVAFTFDFDAEEVWLAEDPDNASRPGTLSIGTYGAKVAIPLLLELLERHGTRCTFFVPGRVAAPGERARSSPPATRSGCTALGASAIFTMHPQIIGRPSRLAFLDDFISFVAAHEEVRIDTCAAIADRVP